MQRRTFIRNTVGLVLGAAIAPTDLALGVHSPGEYVTVMWHTYDHDTGEWVPSTEFPAQRFPLSEFKCPCNMSE